MYKRKHKLPITLSVICLIGLIGFKDTGIFVKDYVSVKDDAIEVEFNREEKVKVLRESDENYLVIKEGNTYEIPMEAMIRTTRKGQKYIVSKNTFIFDKPLGNPIKLLLSDEVVQAVRFDGNYGFFTTEDGLEGYILTADLEQVVAENISYGISTVDKLLKDGKLVYTLLKGESVAIKDFKDNQYIIIDDKGNEFKANEDHIQLKNNRDRGRDKVSRGGNVSRRAASVSKVIEAAYEQIGKPYISAAIGPKGYDCSGLTYAMFLNHLDIKLNRTSRDQAKNGVEVSKTNLIPGDLVFFRTTGKGIGHVGLYIGDGNMIHASSGRRQIMISSIFEKYYNQRYVTARRIIK